MPILPTQTREQFVSNAVAAAQAASDNDLSFELGSSELALTEGDIANWLWLQAQITLVAAAIRLSTSKGSDVDSFIKDFGLTRLPAVIASVNVTFSRFSNTSQVVVQVGAIAQTTTGIEFIVIADIANPAYNASLNGYVMPIGQSNVTVPAQAIISGAAGNVSANTITVISTVIVGVDTVTNPSAAAGGQDKESDDEVKDRFVLFLASLARATKEALEYAITITQDGIKYNLVENIDYTTGSPLLGQFWAVIDGGNGSAPTQLQQNVLANLNRYRAFTIQPAVYATIATNVTITASITAQAGADSTTIINQAETNITNYIASLDVGESLKYNRLSGFIYDADPTNVISVDSLLVNGATSDITVDGKHSIVLTSVTITLT